MVSLSSILLPFEGQIYANNHGSVNDGRKPVVDLKIPVKANSGKCICRKGWDSSFTTKHVGVFIIAVPIQKCICL